MMMMVSLVVLFFTGIICILASSINAKVTKTPDVLYKYIPRDLDTILREDSNQPALVFQKLFEDSLDTSVPRAAVQPTAIPTATPIPAETATPKPI
jgi:hypothetical protein